MKEALVATLWFTLAGAVCAIAIWGVMMPPDIKFVSFIACWVLTGFAPPAFYKLMRQWFD